MDATQFGELMLAHGMNKTEVAAKVGVGKSAVSNALARNAPSLEVWARGLGWGVNSDEKSSQISSQEERVHTSSSQGLDRWLVWCQVQARTPSARWQAFIEMTGALPLKHVKGYLVCDLVRSEKGLTDKIILQTAQRGYPEFDIMEDGFARGYPGDDLRMRSWNRTAHAYRRIIEARDEIMVTEPIDHMKKLGMFKINADGNPCDPSTGRVLYNYKAGEQKPRKPIA